MQQVFTPEFGDPLSFFLADPGWMVNAGEQPFSGLSRNAQLGLGQGSGSASQELSQSCSEATCYFSMSLSCWRWTFNPGWGSEYISSKIYITSSIFLYLAAFLFPSVATRCPVPAAEKQPHGMMLLPLFHCWDCIGQVISSAWFPPHIPLRIKKKT